MNIKHTTDVIGRRKIALRRITNTHISMPVCVQDVTNKKLFTFSQISVSVHLYCGSWLSICGMNYNWYDKQGSCFIKYAPFYLIHLENLLLQIPRSILVVHSVWEGLAQCLFCQSQRHKPIVGMDGDRALILRRAGWWLGMSKVQINEGKITQSICCK